MTRISINRQRYPLHPGSDVMKLYVRLYDEAQMLNRSRGQYAGMVERQREHIASLQSELLQFKDDMALTLQQKAELNRILDGYADVIGELEKAGSALSETYEKNGVWGVFSISTLVEAVGAFVGTFRMAMQQAKEMKGTKALEASSVDR